MEETKPWWQSRTIWTGLIGGVAAVLAIFDMLPTGLDQGILVESILGLTSMAAVIFRAKATKSIQSPLPPME